MVTPSSEIHTSCSPKNPLYCCLSLVLHECYSICFLCSFIATPFGVAVTLIAVLNAPNAFALMNVYFALLFTFIISCRLLAFSMSTNYEMYSLFRVALRSVPLKYHAQAFSQMFSIFQHAHTHHLHSHKHHQHRKCMQNMPWTDCRELAVNIYIQRAKKLTEHIEGPIMTIMHEHPKSLSIRSILCVCVCVCTIGANSVTNRGQMKYLALQYKYVCSTDDQF